jgi:NADPH:quinone reductase-like Zn-dependent oxidoreductase
MNAVRFHSHGGPEARVIATAGSDQKLERALELGANHVIHHHKQDIVEETKRFTDRRGVDIVIEHVGEATWPKSMRALARGGRVVTFGKIVLDVP